MWIGQQGGFAIAPHPMAGGVSMKSLNAFSILDLVRDEILSEILNGIETYNATVFDREANISAGILAERIKISKTGSSDAHVLDAIGWV